MLERFRKTILQGKPLVGTGAGAGIIAKCAELAGIDFICVYSSGRSRIMGLPTLDNPTHADPNTETLKLAPEILFVVKETPVIAGIQSIDLTRRMDELLKQYKDLGFSGVINYPSVGEFGREWMGDYFAALKMEAETMRMAREMDFLTMTYAYRLEEVSHLAPVVDVLIAHAGWTAGGLVGAQREKKSGGKTLPGVAISLSEAAKKVQEICVAAKRINSDIIVLCHGGPISNPQDTQYIYEHTDVVGFAGSSSIERIPVEKAVMDTVKAFKTVKIERK